MTNEEAITDLCLAQADVFYRPKDESIDKAIKALKNHISLEDIKTELNNKSFSYSLTENFENDIVIGVIKVSDMEKILDKHIKENKE